MYYLLAERVGFCFDKTYSEKWGIGSVDALASACTKAEFDAAESKLTVKRASPPDLNGFSEEAGYCYTETCFYDRKLGVLIEKTGKSDFTISASQDCPEWITLMSEIVILKAEMTIVHAAALEKDGRALFLPAKGGVGKTATVVRLIREKGWKLLGDDLVLLDGKSGRIYPFFKPFVIYGYHHDLFPELFKQANSPIRNDTISHIMTKMIPTVKKILRKVPALLRYARAHNPQQIRVKPTDIFKTEELSAGAEAINRSIWLERIPEENVKCTECSAEEIASRCSAVTLMELTYGRMNMNLCLSLMSAAGMLDYDEIYPRVYEIVLQCITRSNPKCLGIPRSLPVECVADAVLDCIS